MAAQRGRKAASGKRSTSTRKKNQQQEFSAEVREEVLLLSGIAITILLFLCNFGIIGKFGDVVSGIMFGLFGILAYIAPLVIFFAVLFGVINLGSHTAFVKLIAGTVLFLDFEVIAALLAGVEKAGPKAGQFYSYAQTHLLSGGVIGGLLAKGLSSVIGIVGAIAVALIVMIITMVLLTEKSFVRGVAGKSRRMYDTAREDIDRRMQLNEEYRERRQEERARKQAEYEEKQEELAAAKKRRMDQKVTGVASDITLNKIKPKKNGANGVNELEELTFASASKAAKEPKADIDELANITIKGISDVDTLDDMEELSVSQTSKEEPIVRKRTHKVELVKSETDQFDVDAIGQALEHNAEKMLHDDYAYRGAFSNVQSEPAPMSVEISNASQMTSGQIHNSANRTSASVGQAAMQTPEGVSSDRPASKVIAKPANEQDAAIVMQVPAKPKPYKKPPMSLLKKNENAGGRNSEVQLKETALQLKQTLKTFGVNVTITDISQGPSVTRYELQPEMGVKVSKIVNLADDIKLNLAATDIRIEAPIPGKAAIGIEVPNKENSMVLLRDMLDTKTFKDFESNIAFAVGKDIAGQTIVTDIGKMPHVLIAGSTGSGKSVCINTLIMSILYKASPEDVKLIMVDPKVVELSVYNGIPHLLLPVVTDPKKASAALQWGVKEMTERYKKFEDMHVRDLKGYNKKVEEMTENDGQPLPMKLPQIVIIVDELADLMMVAPGEVEESICRLAQLARAAGIHLVIATQRPSVDVITGLIKANMPSRIAFAVSSGVDSRTILDMVGAEKLLGKGDMLFYPQGYPKPVRVQGAFVSDKEVADVVDYIVANNSSDQLSGTEIEQQMNDIESGSNAASSSAGSSADDRDQYFADAGRFVIEKDKASIGMLQRVFKIGFNRAARIMDQLCDYGVVGEEEGTKPRKVLMTMNEFEQLLEEI